MKPRFMRIALVLLPALLLATGCSNDESCPTCPTNPTDMPYDVEIDPADFEDTNLAGNSFFPMTPGLTYVYEGENEEGVPVRIEEEYTDQTKSIMGITCAVVIFKEYEDGALVEETSDWYAQDEQGNVWYFGEDSKDIEGGQVVSTEGSWEAGVDGALPGILMFAEPVEGTWYRQEYYEGEAEDVGQVLSLSATVTVPYGTYNNCLQTAEWTPLEPGIVEHKFYASGVGLVKAVAVQGESGSENLVEIISG